MYVNVSNSIPGAKWQNYWGLKTKLFTKMCRSPSIFPPQQSVIVMPEHRSTPRRLKQKIGGYFNVPNWYPHHSRFWISNIWIQWPGKSQGEKRLALA